MKHYITILFLILSLIAHADGLDKTSLEIAKEMAPGWNLGNTLEATGDGLNAETSWQSTKTTKELIDYIAELGFKSIRIPCSWYIHFNQNTTTVNPAWMARVKEVVDYCIDAGLYVVLNDHWDGGWLENSFDDISAATIAAKSDTLKTIWTQIATTFNNDYDEHLLFAGLNEPAVDTQGKTNALIQYEQAFIDAVRATGGNNAKRVLIVQGPGTDIDKTCQYMTTMPDDIVEGKLAVEVHYYAPWQFWGMMQDESWGKMFYYWGADNHYSGSTHNATWGEEDYMAAELDKMKTQFGDKGYAVIIGEYGANWRAITGTGESQDSHNASIKYFYKMMNQLAVARGMVPMAWDTNYCSRPTFTIINRSSLSIYNQYMYEGIFEGVTDEIPAISAVSSSVEDTALFDLQGRRIVSPSGLYIQEGKKYIKR